jgi:hypothetical protein
MLSGSFTHLPISLILSLISSTRPVNPSISKLYTRNKKHRFLLKCQFTRSTWLIWHPSINSRVFSHKKLKMTSMRLLVTSTLNLRGRIQPSLTMYPLILISCSSKLIMLISRMTTPTTTPKYSTQRAISQSSTDRRRNKTGNCLKWITLKLTLTLISSHTRKGG